MSLTEGVQNEGVYEGRGCTKGKGRAESEGVRDTDFEVIATLRECFHRPTAEILDV